MDDLSPCIHRHREYASDFIVILISFSPGHDPRLKAKALSGVSAERFSVLRF